MRLVTSLIKILDHCLCQVRNTMTAAVKRPFSLPIYLFIVCTVSWPFQIAFAVLGDGYRPVLLISMVMAGVGTWVAGRLVFNDGFQEAGWRLGSARFYFLAISLALLLWLFPVAIELLLGINSLSPDFRVQTLLQALLISVLLTVLPAFGEEFSWRGYLLPKLLERYTKRQALLLHGFITWFWHLPFLVTLGLDLESSTIVSVTAVLLISIVPATMHAIVFAWFWAKSGSLFVATFYHVAFDEVRDSLQESIGFAWIAENWQMLVLTLLGLFFVWRTDWCKVNVPKEHDDH